VALPFRLNAVEHCCFDGGIIVGQQQGPQVGLFDGEKAVAHLSIGSQSKAVAVAAKRFRYRCNKSNPAISICKPKFSGRRTLLR
jgi:hypothetical protein